MPSREQVRAEIGRRLREHYDEAVSRTVPDRLARLIDKIKESESRSEEPPGGEHSGERARRVSEECAGVRADGGNFPEPWREGCLAPHGAAVDPLGEGEDD
jgi:Anti-sigma factor NepR